MRRLSVILLALVPFIPYLIASTGIPPRYAYLGVIASFIAFSIGPRSDLRGPAGLGFLIAIGLGAAGLALFLLFNDGSNTGTANSQRFFILFTMAAMAGWILSRSPSSLDFFFRAYVFVAVIFALLAAFENARGESLLGRSEAFAWLVRDGEARALLASEHALVLGVLICAAVPICLSVMHGKARLLLVAILLLGVYATGSRGAWGIALAATVLLVVPQISALASRSWRLILLLFFLFLVGLAYASVSLWEPATFSRDWSENSVEYRAAIYSLVAEILRTAPLGYGAGELPTGVWFISAPDRYIDITRSIDSQVVLAALRFGVPGLGVYILAITVAILAFRRHKAAGVFALTICASGFFVALDAWEGLGALWVLSVAVCVGVMRSPIDPISRPGFSRGQRNHSATLTSGDTRRRGVNVPPYRAVSGP